jgi:hypothetical protein
LRSITLVSLFSLQSGGFKAENGKADTEEANANVQKFNSSRFKQAEAKGATKKLKW